MSSKAKGKSILLWVVGFFVVLFLVYFLFANTIIKLVLESKLGESYGAEVNIAEFDHSLFPTTVTLKGIALTNPTKPTHNQVLVGEANADVALAPLLDDEVGEDPQHEQRDVADGGHAGRRASRGVGEDGVCRAGGGGDGHGHSLR